MFVGLGHTHRRRSPHHGPHRSTLTDDGIPSKSPDKDGTYSEVQEADGSCGAGGASVETGTHIR